MAVSKLMSRLEVNFTRLLSKCESMASENKITDWRFEKYIEALEEKLSELNKLNVCQPSKDSLTEYSRKVEFLRGLIVTEKMPSVTEKAIASQLLVTGSSSTSNSQSKIKEIQLQTQNRYNNAVRDELFNKSFDQSPTTDGVRLRQIDNSSEDLDSLLQYHNNIQEKVAEEMVSLVQNMKQNTMLASRLIKKDIETLEKTTHLAEKNFGNLKVESERLEVHVRNACKWWIWILLGLVCLTFLWMIVFIKLFPKRR